MRRTFFGTYHYCGLESREEADFAELTLKFAANFDERIYQLLDSLKFVQQEARAPEIRNSTLSSKKIFDTFGVKQKSLARTFTGSSETALPGSRYY